MAWDPEVSRQVHEAFDDGNVERFRSLVSEHPEFLRDPDGSDRWMWRAAMRGQLPLVQVLVQLGLDVNESRNREDPDDPFYQAEGPILQAAGSGHLEVVSWLLEHGAKINYVVQGKPRCLPLVHAATEGHLDVVKLLVEHGADIHATWHGVNPTTQAEDYGQFGVRDYLRSLGARTLRETTPPDYPAGQERFLKHMTDRHGPLGEWRLELPGDLPVSLRLIPASDKCDVQVVFTVGLSNHRLPQGRLDSACTELRCMLPADWPMTDAALQDPHWNWPVEWLKRLTCELRVADRWPDEPAVFMNGDPPIPLAPNTRLDGWICLKSLGESVHAPDYRWIDIHSLCPIYAEELALIRHLGHEELINRFQARNVPLCVDPERPNMASISQ